MFARLYAKGHFASSECNAAKRPDQICLDGAPYGMVSAIGKRIPMKLII
jgi:hypothetical protein